MSQVTATCLARDCSEMRRMETMGDPRVFRLRNHFAASNLGAKSCMQGNGRPQGMQQFPRPGHPGPKCSGQHGARPNGGQKASQTDHHNQCYGWRAFVHKFKNCHQARFHMPVCIFAAGNTLATLPALLR